MFITRKWDGVSLHKNELSLPNSSLLHLMENDICIFYIRYHNSDIARSDSAHMNYEFKSTIYTAYHKENINNDYTFSDTLRDGFTAVQP